MKSRLLAGFLWCALLGWAGGIVWLSLTTQGNLPTAAFLFSDKSNHFIAFAIGGWLAATALRVSLARLPITGAILIAITLIGALGALDETLQTFTPGRTGGDLYDWIADFLGGGAGALLTLLTHARLERFITRP